jgi:hypothetical protein
MLSEDTYAFVLENGQQMTQEKFDYFKEPRVEDYED